MRDLQASSYANAGVEHALGTDLYAALIFFHRRRRYAAHEVAKLVAGRLDVAQCRDEELREQLRAIVLYQSAGLHASLGNYHAYADGDGCLDPVFRWAISAVDLQARGCDEVPMVEYTTEPVLVRCAGRQPGASWAGQGLKFRTSEVANDLDYRS